MASDHETKINMDKSLFTLKFSRLFLKVWDLGERPQYSEGNLRTKYYDSVLVEAKRLHKFGSETKSNKLQPMEFCDGSVCNGEKEMKYDGITQSFLVDST